MQQSLSEDKQTANSLINAACASEICHLVQHETMCNSLGFERPQPVSIMAAGPKASWYL